MTIYHIHRYIKYFNESIIISKKQINKWPYNLLDYFIIILYQTKIYKSNDILLLLILWLFHH